MSRISIDVETRAGAKVGVIGTAYDLQFDEPLSLCGTFTFLMPGSDSRRALLSQKRAQVRVFLDETQVFLGVVESMKDSIDQTGLPILEVSGRSKLVELAEATTSDSFDNSTVPHSSVLFNSAGPWTIDTTNGVTNLTNTMYGSFYRETILLAMTRLVTVTGSQFVYKPTLSGSDRKVIWLNSVGTDSGLRAVQGVGDTVAAERNDSICFIQHLSRTEVSPHVYTQVSPYGSGQGQARLTIAASTVTPTGYTVNKANNTVTHDANEAAYGTYGRSIQFKELTPISNTDADLQNAANMLVNATVRWLDRYSTPHTHYTLDVTKLSHALVPGQTINVVYVNDQYDIDDDFIVLEIRTSVGSDGVVRQAILVADVDVMPDDSSKFQVGDLEQGNIYMSHPQMNANAYTTGYRVPLNDPPASSPATGEVNFFFGNEVAQIKQVLFRFKINPLVSTIEATGGESTTTGASSTSTVASGGSSSPTSAGGSAHTHAVPNHDHYLVVTAGGTFWANLGLQTPSGSVSNIQHDGSGNYDVYTAPDSGGTTSASEGSHTHAVDVPAHDHNMEHTHDLTAAVNVTYGVFKDSGNTLLLVNLQWQINSGGWRPFETQIVGVTNPGGGKIEATTDIAHGMSNGDRVYIVNTTSYNGTYTVSNVAATTFRVSIVFVANETSKARTVDSKTSGGNWWQLDVTDKVYDTTTFRPLQENNLLEIKAIAATSGKTASLDGFLNVRSIIQSIAYT